MNEKISPALRFSGTLEVSPDKSITHRAVIFSALAEGLSTVVNPLEAEDCLSSLSCVEALGCRVEKSTGMWRIHGFDVGKFPAPDSEPLVLDCGNSGTTMRLLSGILAAQKFSSRLIGDNSLSSRPMSRVADPLRKMGARISLRDEKFAPVDILGGPPLNPMDWSNSVASAQVKSCVLLAGLHVKGATSYSEPYFSRDHTERMLKAAGADIERIGGGGKLVIRGPGRLHPQSWRVPGDISSAAFFIVGGLLVKNANITLKNVNLNPTRTGILDVLKMAGADIDRHHVREEGGEPMGDIGVRFQGPLKAFSVEEAISPRLIDEVPILAVAATQAHGTSVFRGLGELRVKETDRIHALKENLGKMGAQFSEDKDGFSISGPTALKGQLLDSFGDHRIAMAMAIAGLIADGNTEIKNSDCANISFPAFWKNLRHLCGLPQ